MRGHRRIATSLAGLVLLLLPSAAAAETRELVPWGAGGYRYDQNTSTTTGDAFAKLDFVESGWSGGLAPFGFVDGCALDVATAWNSPELLVRRTFIAPPGTDEGRVDLLIDNDAEVYLNGLPLGGSVPHEGCANVSSPSITIPAGRILGGENLLAIRATDRGVERYLDVRGQAEFVDTDGDGIGDRVDNCRTVPNDTQTDTNQNGVGNACDIGSTNCEGASCFTDRSTPTASTSVTATKSGDDPGWLYLGVNVNPPGPPELLNCANSTEFVPDVFTLDGSDNISEKLVRLKISWLALFDGWRASGLARVQFCFSAPYKFIVRPGYGKLESYEYNGDGVGGEETWYKGVLPECRTLLGKTSPPPCVSGRALLRDGIELRARIPGGDRDPRYH